MTHLARCEKCRKQTEGSGRMEDFCSCPSEKPHLHRTMDDFSKKELEDLQKAWMRTFLSMFPMMSMATGDAFKDCMKNLYEAGYRAGALRGE